MLGISYGQLFVIIAATAVLIKPKDLPIIARTAGRLVGRVVGYIIVTRRQFDNVMQQSQVNQVHKELQDTMAQIEAIRYEIRRNISIMNPVPFTRRLEGMEPSTKNGAIFDERSDTDSKPLPNITKVHKELPDTMAQLEAIRYETRRNISIMNPVPFTRRLEGMEPPTKNGAIFDERSDTDSKPLPNITKDMSSANANPSSLYSEATIYGRLAETAIIKPSLPQISQDKKSLNDRNGLFVVLPVSAESAGLLPKKNGDLKGSDLLLEAIVEEEFAQSAKQFFSQPENQLPKDEELTTMKPDKREAE